MFYHIKCKCINIFNHVYSHVGIRWTISMWGYENKTIVFHTLKQNREGLEVVYCVPYVEQLLFSCCSDPNTLDLTLT